MKAAKLIVIPHYNPQQPQLLQRVPIVSLLHLLQDKLRSFHRHKEQLNQSQTDGTPYAIRVPMAIDFRNDTDDLFFLIGVYRNDIPTICDQLDLEDRRLLLRATIMSKSANAELVRQTLGIAADDPVMSGRVR